MQKTKQIIDKIFFQSQKGYTEIGDDEMGFWPYFTKFFVNVEGQSNAEPNDTQTPIVQIPNEEAFVQDVKSYLDVAKKFYKQDRDYFCLTMPAHQEKLFLDLMINGTNLDYNNIYEYIHNRQAMLEQPVGTGVFVLGQYGDLTMYGAIGKTISNLEGPYCFEFALDDQNKNRFKLPSVTFGIVDDVAYVYAVQNKAKEQDNPLAKKLDRYFRKVNKGVDPEEEISKVSPNALVSLTAFIAFAKQIGITDIVAPDFLPVRYYGNQEVGLRKTTTNQQAETFLEKHDHDQYNMTNKFDNLFFRYGHHFTSDEVTYSELEQAVHVSLSTEEPEEHDDNIIYGVAQCVDAGEYHNLCAGQYPNQDRPLEQ